MWSAGQFPLVVFLDDNRQERVTLLWIADKEKGVIG